VSPLLPFAALIIVAMVMQLAISASWSLPFFRLGLPLYRRGLPALDGRSTREIVEAIRNWDRFTLAFRQLSDHEIGVRGSLVLGFTGVQARVLSGNPAYFVANLGWPAVVTYAYFLGLVLTLPGTSVTAGVMATLILVAIPTIDILLILGTMNRLGRRSSGGA
jgi:hypothetical protein